MPIKENEISETAIIELAKSFAHCQYNSYSDRYPTEWAFTEEQLKSVVQNIISICHIHS